ncbi:MAG: hypothetical protein D8M59_09985 [Planctomycetes bacterium]|nr:hypothetical protein [Planctomycetota bacterium]NOG53412.1 hypothetical protein [Planctomycetota bacterium]
MSGGYWQVRTMAAILCIGVLGHGACHRPCNADELIVEAMPIVNIEIVDISEGEITYLLGSAERHRPIETCVITLTAVPALTDAEAAWGDGRSDEAITAWRAAADSAELAWQKAWVLFRLSIALDFVGRYTEGAAAWAELILIQPDSYWALAAPVGLPDHPNAALKAQALAMLERARAEVENTRLRPLISELITTIAALEEAPEESGESEDGRDAADDGPEEHPPETDDVVIEPEQNEETNQPVVQEPADRPQPVEQAGTIDPSWQRVMDEVLHAACAQRPTNEASQQVQLLMRQGQWEDALGALEEVARNPGTYPLDRLLFEYGWVLSEVGETRVASVRLLQCAILFESSPYAQWSLLRGAWVYRYQVRDTKTADLLLQMAEEFEAGDREIEPNVEGLRGK